MAYLQDPGTLLSNARFGANAFAPQTWATLGTQHYQYDPAAKNWLEATFAGQGDGSPTFTGYSTPVSDPSVLEQLSRQNTDPTAYFLSGQGLESFGSNKEAMLNSDNIKVVGKDPKTGGYLVMSKSGDKTGTVYAVMPTPDGSYMSAGVVQKDVPFDTNSPWWKEALPIIMVASGPLFAYGGQVVAGAANALATGAATTISEALSIGAQTASAAGAAAGAAATFPTGVADPFMLAGANTGTAVGTAAGTAANASSVIPSTGPGDALSNIGYGEQFAQTINPATGLPYGPGGVAGGAYSTPGLTTNALPTGAPTPAITNISDVLQGAEPVFATPETVPPIMDQITNKPPVTTPPGGTPPGGPPKVPTPGGTSPGGPSGGNGSNAWMLPLILADMYNKYAMGNNIRDTMEEWSNKIFGKSADFENMLMNTYTNPNTFVTGPEGQALSSQLANTGLRQSLKLGQGTNSTNRDRLWQQGMLQGLNNYRSGLVNSSNIGRSQSGEVMRGIGEGLKGGDQAASWYTPGTFGAGNQGSNNPLQVGQDIWNMAGDAWNWLKGQKWPWEG